MEVKKIVKAYYLVTLCFVLVSVLALKSYWIETDVTTNRLTAMFGRDAAYWRQIAEIPRFVQTAGGIITECFGLLLFFLGASCVVMKGSRKSLVLIPAVALILAMMTGLASAAEQLHYDVWIAMDEECRSFGYQEHQWHALEYVSAYFYDTFNIYFHFHGWSYYESNDYLDKTVDLYVDAIDRLDWYHGKMIDGEHTEMLIVFVGQDMDMIGLSIPEEKMALVDGHGIEPTFTIGHEVGHQFFRPHHMFTLGCWMSTYPAAIFYARGYCSDCEQHLNRYAIWYTVPNPTVPRYGGGNGGGGGGGDPRQGGCLCE